jgi:hypothetical protein
MPSEKFIMTIREMKDACRRYRALQRGTLPGGSKRKGKFDFRYDIEKRAKQGLKITHKRIVEDQDDEGDTYRKITCVVSHPITLENSKNVGGSGAPHTLEILIYDVDGIEDNAKIAANCDCEHFLYACEVALRKEGSARIEEPFEMRIWSNDEDYTDGGPNPSSVPIICKHIYAAILNGLFKWKKPALSLEEKRKLELRKEREEKRRIEKEKKEKAAREKIRKERLEKNKKLTKKQEPKKVEPKSTIKKPPAIKAPPKPPPSKWKRK